MPQAANIVINDGAGSPVAHTFTPLGKDEKGVLWLEQTTPTPANPSVAKRIGISQKRGFTPTGQGGQQLNQVTKVTLALYVPTGETLAPNSSGITPPPTIAYQEVARQEFTLPERGLKQERKDTRVLYANLLANALVVSMIDDLQLIY